MLSTSLFLSWSSLILAVTLIVVLYSTPFSEAFSLTNPRMVGSFQGNTMVQKKSFMASSRSGFGRRAMMALPAVTKSSSPQPSTLMKGISQALVSTNGNNDQQQQHQQQQSQDLANKGWKWSTIFMAGAVAAISVGAYVNLRRSMEMKRKLAIENANRCPYCKGTGTLLCAGCMGGDTNTQDGSCPCSICQGKTVVSCVNCKGSGSMIVS